jgi:hypothetical protein
MEGQLFMRARTWMVAKEGGQPMEKDSLQWSIA